MWLARNTALMKQVGFPPGQELSPPKHFGRQTLSGMVAQCSSAQSWAQGYWSREHRQHPQGSTASQVVWGQSPALTFTAASKTKVKVAVVASTFE